MTTKTQVSIGGSTAAAAVGLDPFRSRVQLWLEETGRVPRPDTSEQMKWGTLLEPVIAAEIVNEGYRVQHLSTSHLVPPPPEYPWAYGHPDGWILASKPEERGVLEIKTASAYRSREWADGAVPTAYVIQVSHYMALTGLTWALVACLIGGQRLELRRVERDETLIENLMRAEEEFVRLVETDTPPAPDGSDSSNEMLRLLYPESNGQRVTLTAADMELVHEIKTLKRSVKASDAQLDELENRLRARLGDAESGWYEGVRVVSWPTIRSQRLDISRLKEERPEIHAEYLKESSYRALRVSGS